MGFNPIQTGFIAATDSHNSNPGDVEEWDYVGAVGAVTSPAARRLRDFAEVPAFKSTLKFHTSGGLAACGHLKTPARPFLMPSPT